MMKDRKTKAQKVKSQQRKLKNMELVKLKNQLFELQRQIEEQKKENIKNFCIRNLKIFGCACNFAVPFVLSAGLCVGSVKLLGGGFPFVIDKQKKYKVYSLEYETDKIVNLKTWYQTNEWYSDLIPKNKLKIYFPWEVRDNDVYSRVIRDYIIDNQEVIPRLMDVVYFQNINYILENFEVYNEEIESTNILNLINNKCIIDACLSVLDETDYLLVDEGMVANFFITLLEMIAVLGSGALGARIRKFKLISSVNDIKEEYQLDSVEILQSELNNVQNKILSLTKGGKMYEK